MKQLALILAAGFSKRFGPEDKLLADLGGTPVIQHVAYAAQRLELDDVAVVLRSQQVAGNIPKLSKIWLDEKAPVLSDSLRAGAEYAMARQFDQVLVLLGDMPFVSTKTMQSVIDLQQGTPSAATNGIRALPPACFPRSSLPELAALTGDQGGRTLLQRIGTKGLYRAPKAELVDIDTPSNLKQALRNLAHLQSPKGG